VKIKPQWVVTPGKQTNTDRPTDRIKVQAGEVSEVCYFL
jgi:hypothetical protein